MAYQYLLNVLLRGHADPVEFEVRESDWSRAQDLFSRGDSFYRPARFLTVDTVEGLAVAISLSDVQLVRFLWNAVKFPSDQKHKDDHICIWLRGREVPIKVVVDEEKESLAAFFTSLDAGAENTLYPGLSDVDDELSLFNANEIVLVTASLYEVKEGHQLLRGDDTDDAGGSGTIHF